MFRRIVLVGSGALALSAVLIGPATAKVTGNVNCMLTGSAAISPGLPLNSPGTATKKFKTTVTFTGTLSNCTGTQTGTKKGAQIDGGTVVATAKTTIPIGQALPSCAGLTAPTTPTVLTATVKFTNAGKSLTSSKAHLTVGPAMVDTTVSFPAAGLVSGGAAFKGQTLTATAILDKTATDFATLCNAPGGLTTLSFTAAQGESTLVSSGPLCDAGATGGCVAEEPADKPALLELAAWADLPTLRTGKYLQITSTDRGTMVFPPMAPGNRDYNNYVCRGQEGVVAGGGLGAFDLIYVDSPTCPETYVKGLVAARVEGSGRLARLWATGLDLAIGGPVKEAVFRIYVDDKTEPFIELRIGDGKTPPASLEIFAAPFGANTSNNLAWYYPVVFSKKLIISIDNIPNNLMWYQASFVLDEQSTQHKRATKRLPARDRAKALLGSIGAPVPDAAPLAPASAVSLPTDTPVTVATLTGPATVHSFRVRVPDATIAALNMIDVAVTWDADMAPAIAMPLGDLFASEAGMADTPTSSLPLAITKAAGETILDLRLPMPFATRAVIVLTNHAAATTVSVAIDGLASLPAEPWGHLVAIRSETVGPTTNTYHPVVTASGEGRLVGVCLMAEGHASPLLPSFIRGPMNFLEGDEQIKIDGQTFRGTGTEDYFDSAFYFDPAAAGFPFAQWGGKVADVLNDKGKVSACRWHILGTAIDFHQSLDLSIEIGPPDPASLNRYVTTAFLYRPR